MCAWPVALGMFSLVSISSLLTRHVAELNLKWKTIHSDRMCYFYESCHDGMAPGDLSIISAYPNLVTYHHSQRSEGGTKTPELAARIV